MKTKLAAVLVLPAVMALGHSSPGFAQDHIVKIGHAGPVSGSLAHLGKDNENGARLAIDELNAKGVTIGGRKVRFELLAEDDAGDPKQGSAVAQKFCDAKVHGVVGHLDSGTSMAASKIYNDCGIPSISPSATNPKLTSQGFKTSFRLMADDGALGAGLATAAARDLSVKKVAVVDDGSAYGKAIAEAFKANARNNGIQVVAEKVITSQSTDFSSILDSIRSARPDAIFFGGMDAQAGPMLRQMEGKGMSDVKFLGGDGMCTTNLQALSGGAKTLGNAFCAEAGTPVTKMPGGDSWKKRYDSKFPGQFQLYSPYSYDAVYVLVDAMVRAKSTDPKVYGRELFNVNHKGVTGQISFTSSGDPMRSGMTIYRMSQSGPARSEGTPTETCPTGQCYCKRRSECIKGDCKTGC